MSKLPNVVFDLSPLSSRSRYRGIGMYAAELAQAMHVRWRGGDYPFELRYLVGGDHRMRVVSGDPTSFMWDTPVNPSYTSFQTARLAFGRFALRGADVFHSAEGAATPVLGLRKTLVTCHDVIPTVLGGTYTWPMPRIYSEIRDKIRYGSADHVICISEATRADVVKYLGLPEKSITVIGHGVDSVRFSPEPVEGEDALLAEAIPPGRPYWLYVGAFDSRKRVGQLIEAFASTLPKSEQRLVIAGKRTDREKVSHSLLMKAHGLTPERLVFCDYVSDKALPVLYRHATAHVLSSTYEGFGLTLVEAMACGCPVIARRVSAMPEVCGDAAVWIENDTAASVAVTLETVEHDGGLRAQMRQAGIARAKQFTWDRTAEATLALYTRLV